MGKSLLAANTCIQDDVDIDKKLLMIIQKEVDYTTICNLEGFIMNSGDLSGTLASSPKHLAKFAEAMKIKAVSLANNHICDGRKVGIQKTLKALTAKRATKELAAVLRLVTKEGFIRKIRKTIYQVVTSNLYQL